MSPHTRNRMTDAVWALAVVIIAIAIAFLLTAVWSLRSTALDSREQRDLLASDVETLRAQLSDLGAEPAVGPPAVVGERGPAGDRGERGRTGPQGPPGADGADGEPGADGQDGTDGQDGASIIGPIGPIGPQGPVGPQGPAGPTGATGPAGADGEDATLPDPITFIIGTTTYTCHAQDSAGTYICSTSIDPPIGD